MSAELSLSFMNSWSVTDPSDPEKSTPYDSWGPPPKVDTPFDDLPFAPFSKRDAVNYISDWYSNRPGGGRKRVGDDDAVLSFDKAEGEDHFADYSVNVHKYQEQKQKKAAAKKAEESGGRVFIDTTKQLNRAAEAHAKMEKRARSRIEGAISRISSKKKSSLYTKRKRTPANLRPNVYSVRRDEQWTQIDDLPIPTMIFDDKDAPTDFETLFTAGTLHKIMNVLDRVSCVRPIPLNMPKYGSRMDGYRFAHFDWTSASQDPYIVMNLANQGIANVYSTDQALTVLMNMRRSQYSWDLVVTKMKGTLWIESRPNNPSVSFQSVDETSPNRPTQKSVPKKDQWDALAVEATGVRYALTEQLTEHNPKTASICEKTHPFKDDPILVGSASASQDASEGSNATGSGAASSSSSDSNKPFLASAAYVYRKFTTSDGLTFVVRCTVDGVDQTTGQLCKVVSLFQYNHLLSKSICWSKDLDLKESSIIFEEMRHNSFYQARVASSLVLAGIEKVKLGFIARKQEFKKGGSKGKSKYEILGVKNCASKHMCRKFAQLNPKHQWGAVSYFVNLFKEMNDGRYVIAREPVKHNIRIFSVPDSSFEKGAGIETALGSLSMLRENVKRPRTLPRYFV